MNNLLILIILIFCYLLFYNFFYQSENFISFRPWKNYDKIKKSSQNIQSKDDDKMSENDEVIPYEIVDKGILNDYELLDNDKKTVCKIDGNIDLHKFKLNCKYNNKNIEIKLIKDVNDYFTFNFNSNNYKIILQNELKITKNEFENYKILIGDNRINFDDSGYSIGYIENKSIYNNTNIFDNYFIMFIFYILYKEIRENTKDYDKIFKSKD